MGRSNDEKNHCDNVARALAERAKGLTYVGDSAIGPVNWWIVADVIAKERAAARREALEQAARVTQCNADECHARGHVTSDDCLAADRRGERIRSLLEDE